MDNLVEQTRKYLEEEPDDELEPLNEIISFRTVAIGGLVAKIKQVATKIDGEVRRLHQTASSLSRSKSPEEGTKPLADALQTIGNLFYLQRKMQMYQSLVSASGGLGADRTYKFLRKMEKRLK